jgi:valyl-tRNA synthetase
MTDSATSTAQASTTSESNGAADFGRYDHTVIEPVWMQRWQEAGAFDAEVDRSREPYSIVIPPPNVTGALHMGHALNGSVQDVLIRTKRMQGYNALWLPGVDHAGIATQAVVEKKLRAEGTNRHELGREKFLEQVWEWKHQYGSTIIEQFKTLGCSCDYRRERFTMDEQYANAVLHAFVQLYDKGYIYRDNYLVSWDAGTMSAISDLEVVQTSVTDEMVEVDYPLEDGSGHLTVATVRAETIVADTAVAVHPDDDRYKHLIGKMVKVPLTDRVVPIIGDEHVDIEFGTGALKITPGHDPNDFEIGRKHGLPELTAIDFDRTMTDLAGEFAGLAVDDARAKMLGRLEEQGLLRSREPYKHNVPHSERSGVRIEPLISLQWFANMNELAQPAIAAIETGDVRFVPDSARNIFNSWMTSLRPWCLSRQLWWGHQLPVWYCAADESHVHVSLDGPGNAACPDCGNTEWVREEDVLDTWFSSGLWDSATLGWPEKTPELEHFHPTSVLLTAREIINLWVARMMMFSFEFLGEKPFSDVYIHSVIQAPDGRRMSKSLGTGIDPLELIGKFGADATRYGLLTMSSTQDVRFNEGKISEGRDLANKLWNAVRLLVMLGDGDSLAVDGFNPEAAERLEDRWILSRLDATQRDLTGMIDRYEFALATKLLYHFVWSELCDWYLESVKARLRSKDSDERAVATQTLAFVVDRTLRMMHPFMPHVTEQLRELVWGADGGFLMTSPWYDSTLSDPDTFAAAQRGFGCVQALITRLRSLRQSAGVSPKQVLDLRCSVLDDSGEVYVEAGEIVSALAGVAWREEELGGIALPVAGATIEIGGLDAFVLKERLETELKNAEQEQARAEKKLGDERFVSRAPAELVDAEREKASNREREARELRALLEQL